MVGATEIIKYLTHLLSGHFYERDLQLIFSIELLVFFIQPPAVQRARLLSPSNSKQPALVLDHKLRDYGSVVPQSISTPATPGDALRYKDVSLKMPIFFVLADRKTLGLRLRQAVASKFAKLLNTQVDMGLMTICIKVSVFQVTHHGAIVRIAYTSSGQATANRSVTSGLCIQSKDWQQGSQVWYALFLR